MTKPLLTEQDLINALAVHVLPLFNELLEKQGRLEDKVDHLEIRFDQLSDDLSEFKAEFHDFKHKQLTFNDHFIKDLEELRIEYSAICNQLEEYDNFFHDPKVPEKKKQSAFKQMILKISSFETRLNFLEKRAGLQA